MTERHWQFERVAPLHAARTSQRDVPTTLNTYDAGSTLKRIPTSIGRRHGVHLAQLGQQRDEALARAVTHQADLNPVAVSQVLALVAEEKAGGLELVAGFLRADRFGQRQGDDGRR